MTQGNKELLLKDLCARLPYHTIVKYRNADVDLTQYARSVKLTECKPYLRPMSSMTEEEKFQLGRLLGATSYNLLKGEYSSLKELLEYFYKKHIDLFGLIPKGFALKAPEDMYK